MQTPVNTSERSSAFWKFFFFFIVTLTMTITAVYFNFKMPYKENALLKEKAEKMQLQAMAQEKFTARMIQAKALIDSMGKPGVNIKYIGDQVADKLRDLTNLHIADSSLQGSMNKVIIDVFLDYNKLKGEITNVSDAQSQIADLTTKYNDVMRERDQLRRDLDLYLKGTGR
jgi:GTP1/Obg family GTP-binding protein